MDIYKTQEMYERDPVFHTLVDTILAGMMKMEYTASEVRAAAMLAALHFEQTKLRPILVGKKEFDKLG